jgi:hypothetical protein
MMIKAVSSKQWTMPGKYNQLRNASLEIIFDTSSPLLCKLQFELPFSIKTYWNFHVFFWFWYLITFF